jgi:hypothetical protein
MLVYQEQSRLLRIDQHHQRMPVVASIIKDSPENAGSIFVQELFIPSLTGIINELQNQILLLQKEMEQSRPILQMMFPLSVLKSQLQTRSAEVIKKNREVCHLEHLLARFCIANVFGIND